MKTTLRLLGCAALLVGGLVVYQLKQSRSDNAAVPFEVQPAQQGGGASQTFIAPSLPPGATFQIPFDAPGKSIPQLPIDGSDIGDRPLPGGGIDIAGSSDAEVAADRTQNNEILKPVVTGGIGINLDSTAVSLNITGANNRIGGPVDAQGDIDVTGAQNTITGTRYRGTLRLNPNSAAPGSVRRDDVPYSYSEYTAVFEQPSATQINGYTNMTSSCTGGSNGTWNVPNNIADNKVYYAACNIDITGPNRTINASFVSSKTITVRGPKTTLGRYRNWPSLTARSGVNITGAQLTIKAGIFVDNGPITVTGAQNNFNCDILADTLNITGANNTFAITCTPWVPQT